MAILSRQSAFELRRIIRESTGRNISLGEAYAIWYYLLKLLKLLWKIEKRQRVAVHEEQMQLFDS